MRLQNRTESAVNPADSLSPIPGKPNAPDRRHSLEHALMAAVREPMAMLDRNFHVLAASRAYHRLFPPSLGAPFCDATGLQWNPRALETLTDVAASGRSVEDVEIELDVPGSGPHSILLSARQLCDRLSPDAVLMVGLHDLTDAREAVRLKAELAAQQAVLLQEAHHRIANSLQIIASILLLKARSVTSEETRMHLRDVHKRLILVAAVQRQLCNDGMLEAVEFGPYVAKLCEGLASSMTDGDSRVTIVTTATAGTIKCDDAISFGLIVTELVINALKHGYPDGRGGCITVDFAASGADWRLSVSDDGIGRRQDAGAATAGLGTNIVEALARHLKAKVEIADGAVGSSTAIVHAEHLTAAGQA